MNFWVGFKGKLVWPFLCWLWSDAHGRLHKAGLLQHVDVSLCIWSHSYFLVLCRRNWVTFCSVMQDEEIQHVFL